MLPQLEIKPWNESRQIKRKYNAATTALKRMSATMNKTDRDAGGRFVTGNLWRFREGGPGGPGGRRSGCGKGGWPAECRKYGWPEGGWQEFREFILWRQRKARRRKRRLLSPPPPKAIQRPVVAFRPPDDPEAEKWRTTSNGFDLGR